MSLRPHVSVVRDFSLAFARFETAHDKNVDEKGRPRYAHGPAARSQQGLTPFDLAPLGVRLLVVDFALALADPRAAIRLSGFERVDVLVPRHVLQLFFVVREVVLGLPGELEVLG